MSELGAARLPGTLWSSSRTYRVEEITEYNIRGTPKVIFVLILYCRGICTYKAYTYTYFIGINSQRAEPAGRQLVSHPCPWSSPIYSRPHPGGSLRLNPTPPPPPSSSSFGSFPAAAGHGLPHRPRQPQPLGHHREDHRRVHMVRRAFPCCLSARNALSLCLASQKESILLDARPPSHGVSPSGT